MNQPFVPVTTHTGPLVRDYLAENGPSSTRDLLQMFGSGVSMGAFHRRLKRMQEANYIEDTAERNQPCLWVAIGGGAAKRAERPDGVVAPCRSYNLMSAPVWVPTVMQTARLSAIGHAELYASRRGDVLVPNQAPMHMCSGLSGGMK